MGKKKPAGTEPCGANETLSPKGMTDILYAFFYFLSSSFLGLGPPILRIVPAIQAALISDIAVFAYSLRLQVCSVIVPSIGEVIVSV